MTQQLPVSFLQHNTTSPCDSEVMLSILLLTSKTVGRVILYSIHGNYLVASPDQKTLELREQHSRNKHFWEVSVVKDGFSFLSEHNSLLALCGQQVIAADPREDTVETAWIVSFHDNRISLSTPSNCFLRAGRDGKVGAVQSFDCYCLWLPLGTDENFSHFFEIPRLGPLSEVKSGRAYGNPDKSRIIPVETSTLNVNTKNLQSSIPLHEWRSGTLWSFVDFTSLLIPSYIKHRKMPLTEKCRIFNPSMEWIDKEKARNHRIFSNFSGDCLNCSARHGLNIIILAKCRLIWNTLPCGEKVPGLSLLYSRYFDVTPGEFLGNILGSEDPRLVRSPEGFMEMHFNALNTNFRTMFSAKVNTENLMVMDVRPTQFDLHVQVSDLSKFIEKNWCPVSCQTPEDPYFFILRSKPLLAYNREGKLNTKTQLLDSINASLSRLGCCSIRGSTPGLLIRKDHNTKFVLFLAHSVKKDNPENYPTPDSFSAPAPGSQQANKEWYTTAIELYKKYRKRYFMSFLIYKYSEHLDTDTGRPYAAPTLSLHSYTPFFLPPNRFEENGRIYFPTGLLAHGEGFIVSYGEADTTCRMTYFKESEILARMQKTPIPDSELLNPNLFDRKHSETIGCGKQYPFPVTLFEHCNFFPFYLGPGNPENPKEMMWFDSSLHLTVQVDEEIKNSEMRWMVKWQDVMSVHATKKQDRRSLVGEAEYRDGLIILESPEHQLVAAEVPSYVASFIFHFQYSPSDMAKAVNGNYREEIDGVISLSLTLDTDSAVLLHIVVGNIAKFSVPLAPKVWHTLLICFSAHNGLFVSLDGNQEKGKPLPIHNETRHFDLKHDRGNVIDQVRIRTGDASLGSLAFSEIIFLKEDVRYSSVSLSCYLHTKWMGYPCAEASCDDYRYCTAVDPTRPYWTILWRVRTAHYRHFLELSDAQDFYDRRCTKKGTKVLYEGALGGKMLQTNANDDAELQTLLDLYDL